MVLCSILTLLRLVCKLIMAENKERTFIMVKPDGVQRGLVGKIIQRFEDKGFKLVALNMVWVSFSTRLCEKRADFNFMRPPGRHFPAGIVIFRGFSRGVVLHASVPKTPVVFPRTRNEQPLP